MTRRPTSRISAFLRCLTENQRGATVVEYTLVVTTISLVTIVGINTIGEALVGTLGNLIP